MPASRMFAWARKASAGGKLRFSLSRSEISWVVGSAICATGYRDHGLAVSAKQNPDRVWFFVRKTRPGLDFAAYQGSGGGTTSPPSAGGTSFLKNTAPSMP